MCKNGECIDYHKLCNGIPDCDDGSDEDVKGQRPECKQMNTGLKSPIFPFLAHYEIMYCLKITFLNPKNKCCFIVFKVSGISSRFD